MFTIDKERFGAFIARLRKEQGLTQKEVAAQVAVSDKAVSKWERGLSLPDVTLLVPLAELYGVTVTELLECRRIEPTVPLAVQDADALVRGVIALSGRKARRMHWRGKWLFFWLAALLSGAAGYLLLWRQGYDFAVPGGMLCTLQLLTAAFAAYFCLFALEELPAYYDENRIGAFYDGPFRMNLPGISFNNRNWPHVVRTLRISLLAVTAGAPPFFWALARSLPTALQPYSKYLVFAAFFAMLFLPLYRTARKYE